MELMEGLLTRRSVRKFEDKPVPKEILEQLVKAGEYAPSAHNTRPWEFLVLQNKDVLKHFRVVQRSALFAENAAAVILICGREDLSFSREKEGWSYIDIDCAAATENVILAAHALGLGACWCGAAPMSGPIAALKEYFKLPENVRPFSIVVLGYPAETPKQPERFDASRIHWEKW